MSIPGRVVQSLQGHDKGRCFFVTAGEGDYVFLVDGKTRKLQSPKRKKAKHVEVKEAWAHPIAARIAEGMPVLDRDIRRALGAFRDKESGTKEGMTLGKK